nr:hypothetical protein [Tanacetum cinerariifolium]
MNNEAKITLYNALPRKEYELVFMCKTAKKVWHTLIITHKGNSQVKNCKGKIDLLTQEYENKNHVRKFLCALLLKWRANVTTTEEAKDLATLPFDEIIENLKVYEMVLDNDAVGSKTTKEKVKSLALKVKFTMEQTSDDSDSQGGSGEDIDEEKEEEAFNMLSRNFHKFFRKGNRFRRGNQFGNGGNRFGKGRNNGFGKKVVKA